MKFKQILTFFLIVFPVCVCSRFLQILFVEDPTTAFFRPDFVLIGNILSALIIVSCLGVIILSCACYERPEKKLYPNVPLAISSIILGVGIGYEILTETFTATIKIWQISTLDILGIFSVVFFILYGVKVIMNFPLPKLFAIVPSLYFIMRLICIFTSISAISLIVDNVITLASHCFVLIFMANFAKLINGVDSDKNFKKIAASGLCATLLCSVDAIPRIIFILGDKGNYIHSSVSSPISVLLYGLFIFSFSLCYFKTEKH